MTIDTLSLNVIGFSTKFILHVIVLQSSLIVQPSSSVWDIPEHEAPTKNSLSNPRHNDFCQLTAALYRLASCFTSVIKGFEHITKYHTAE